MKQEQIIFLKKEWSAAEKQNYDRNENLNEKIGRYSSK